MRSRRPPRAASRSRKDRSCARSISGRRRRAHRDQPIDVCIAGLGPPMRPAPESHRAHRTNPFAPKRLVSRNPGGWNGLRISTRTIPGFRASVGAVRSVRISIVHILGNWTLLVPGAAVAVTNARCAFCVVARHAGGYRVERVLAPSPHGRVYRAHAPDGEIVPSRSSSSPVCRGRRRIDAFRAEAATLKTLHHARIPRFVASLARGRGCPAAPLPRAEFIEGERSPRGSQEAFSESDAQRRRAPGCSASRLPAKLGVLHRDIKPTLIVRPGGENRAGSTSASARRLPARDVCHAGGNVRLHATEQLGAR